MKKKNHHRSSCPSPGRRRHRLARLRPRALQPDPRLRQHRDDRGRRLLQDLRPARRTHGGRRRPGQEGPDDRAPRRTNWCASATGKRPALAPPQSQLAQAGTAVELAERHARRRYRAAPRRPAPPGSPARRTPRRLRPRRTSRPGPPLTPPPPNTNARRRDWERAQTLLQERRHLRRAVRSVPHALRDRHRRRSKHARNATRWSRQDRARRRSPAPAPRSSAPAAALKLAEANQIDLQRREQELTTRRAEIDAPARKVALIDSRSTTPSLARPWTAWCSSKPPNPARCSPPAPPSSPSATSTIPGSAPTSARRDLGRVKLGAAVKVTTDSYPGKIYAGRVTFISSQAEFTPKQIQTRRSA